MCSVTTVYKLTDVDGYTRRGETGETHWPIGGVVEPTGLSVGDPPQPCGPGVLHGYHSPLLAALLAPLHGVLDHPCLLRCEVSAAIHTDGLKLWWAGDAQVLAEELLPVVGMPVLVRWAVLVSLEQPQPDAYQRWAERWLSGEDRSRAAQLKLRHHALPAAASWAAQAARSPHYGWAASWAAQAAAAAAAAGQRDASDCMQTHRMMVHWFRVVNLHAFAFRLHGLAEQAIREEGP
jgi:hypothetical protein